MCSACAGDYQDPDRTAPTAEDLDAVAAERRVKEATDKQGEVIARLRRHGLTPAVDWNGIERRRMARIEEQK